MSPTRSQTFHTLQVSVDELRRRTGEGSVATPYLLRGVSAEMGRPIQLCLEVRETSDSIIVPAEVIWRQHARGGDPGGVGVVIPHEVTDELDRWMQEVLANLPAETPAAAAPLLKAAGEIPELRSRRDTIVPRIEAIAESVEVGGLSIEGDFARNPRAGEYVAAKFEVTEEIGRGGVSVIYRARHSVLSKRVALKMLQENLPDKQSVGQLFLNEARILCSLETPHVPAVFDFGVDAHFGPFFVMEHLMGETLGMAMARMEPEIREKEFYRIALDLVIALDSVHKEGIVHCDLKPDNIWMAREENLTGERHYMKLFDFGISRPAADAGDREKKRSIVSGTPDFMAPEQIMGERLDERTDMYALGVIFYMLLSGDVPFAFDEPYEILQAHLDEHPQPLNKRRRKPIGRRLDSLVLRLLSKDPIDRYPSAEVVFHSLKFLRDRLEQDPSSDA